MKLKSSLPAALKYQAVVIESAAREAGLDFFEVVFELLDAADVNGIAAYGGFPVRYPSWRFGMDYERLEKGRTWGLSKIYELVINNDPTYAYLVASNSLLEQKLVMAHVYGHADFFKHNIWFAPTDRHMIDTIGDHASRVRRIIDVVGQERVEQFMDRALSLETMIDPYLPLRKLRQSRPDAPDSSSLSERSRAALEVLSGSPAEMLQSAEPEEVPAPKLVGDFPTFDILGFLGDNAPLEPWELSILHIVRREAYYFSPQRMTKIMNEGWASFWHSRLLTGGLLDASEICDFADAHSGATSCQPGALNPYKLGIELFRYAEERGEDIFQLRRVHNDVSLIDKLADEEFTERFLRAPVPQQPGVPPGAAEAPPSWREVKAQLLHSLSWGGLPQIELTGVGPEGELQLVHHHDGRDLQLAATGESLKYMAAIWRAPVHLLTLEDGEGRRIVATEDEVSIDEAEDAAASCSEDSAA